MVVPAGFPVLGTSLKNHSIVRLATKHKPRAMSKSIIVVKLDIWDIPVKASIKENGKPMITYPKESNPETRSKKFESVIKDLEWFCNELGARQQTGKLSGNAAEQALVEFADQLEAKYFPETEGVVD